jgi:type I restriction enzyme, S subunit
MIASKTKSSWFNEKGVRLDATYHLSDGRRIKFLLNSCSANVDTLGSLTNDIFLGSRFRRVFVRNEKYGIPYVTASDMTLINPISNTFLSKKMTLNQQLLKLGKGWILISCSGSIGNVVFTNEDFDGKIGTHDLIRVIPDENKIKPGFLYSFLSSKYGYALLTQSNYGGVIQHIEPEHIVNIPVPILDNSIQNHTHALIEKSSILKVKANRLLESAKDAIIDKIGIGNTETICNYSGLNN